MRNLFTQASFFIFVLFVGIVIGISIDKEWLTEQEISYVNTLKLENKLLQEQQNQWLAFVEDEMRQINVFIPSENEHYNGLSRLLTQIGIEAQKIYNLDTVLQNKGIIITLGDELDFPSDIPHLSLDMIPEQENEINQFYVSLLRMKEYKPKTE